MTTRALLTLWLLPALAVQAEPPSISGRWVLRTELFGTVRYQRLQLQQDGAAIAGELNGDKLAGKLEGARLRLTGTGEQGSSTELDAALEGRSLTGTLAFHSPLDADATLRFTGLFAVPIERRPPRRHDFAPTVFHRQFSPSIEPALRIAPGDVVHTTTVDAGGVDERGIKRSAGGNPQTGPFFVEGALPGDTLVVHLSRVRLNRGWAGSDDGVVESALDSRLAVKMKDGGKPVRWKLDLARGLAMPESPGEHLAGFSVPLRPMLGCVATAPGPGGAPPPTGDSGYFGGNMDFNEIGEGATVYLPVSNPGALLYLGDGHAAQGDGEITGNALETSMDVEFSVDVIQDKRIGFVRVETPAALIAMGLGGSLDDAFKTATSNMAQWLADDYRLTPSETAQVLGAAAQYKVSEVADRNSGIVLSLDKDRLRGLAPASDRR